MYNLTSILTCVASYHLLTEVCHSRLEGVPAAVADDGVVVAGAIGVAAAVAVGVVVVCGGAASDAVAPGGANFPHRKRHCHVIMG